jgi:hypothetical protein|tara:strand:+ start:188 stop:349 length:162 start_codon:yes stop_codon:yes gene_type:complete
MVETKKIQDMKQLKAISKHSKKRNSSSTHGSKNNLMLNAQKGSMIMAQKIKKP